KVQKLVEGFQGGPGIEGYKKAKRSVKAIHTRRYKASCCTSHRSMVKLFGTPAGTTSGIKSDIGVFGAVPKEIARFGVVFANVIMGGVFGGG
ncbi:12182_t:CDS:2, partial [Racocetra persica]